MACSRNMQSSSSPSPSSKNSRHYSVSSASTAAATQEHGHEHGRPGRERAKSDFIRSAEHLPLGFTTTATSTAQQSAEPAPLHLLASDSDKSSRSTPHPHQRSHPHPHLHPHPHPTLATHPPSAPIPIPVPRLKEDFDCPITPLSARGDGRPSAYLGRSLKPKYMKSPDNTRHVNYFSDSSDSSASSTKKPQRDVPKSPLSPSMPLAPFSPRGQDPAPHPTALRLPPLPRFHPAAYESASLQSTAHTPRKSRPSGHGRQYSDAKQQIHRYQRDIVATATRAARLTLSPKATQSPSSPRLHPIGSPGPVTPLALESEVDYLMARDTGSPSSTKNNGRDLVESLVRKENERRVHTQRAENLSPAVSPAAVLR